MTPEEKFPGTDDAVARRNYTAFQHPMSGPRRSTLRSSGIPQYGQIPPPPQPTYSTSEDGDGIK